jgi:hypothetical protein
MPTTTKDQIENALTEQGIEFVNVRLDYEPVSETEYKRGWFYNTPDGATIYLGRNVQAALSTLGTYENGMNNGANDGPKGTIYLLHFDRPMAGKLQTQHYLGWTGTKDPNERLTNHQLGKGAALPRAASKQGIGFTLVRTWTDVTKQDERKKKKQSHLARLCPICQHSGRGQQNRKKYPALLEEPLRDDKFQSWPED